MPLDVKAVPPGFLFAHEESADPRILEALNKADAVLISAGPDEAGDPVLRRFAHDIETSKSLRWIGYLSTIGVYGDADGGWVDETVAPTEKKTAVSMAGSRELYSAVSWAGAMAAL